MTIPLECLKSVSNRKPTISYGIEMNLVCLCYMACARRLVFLYKYGRTHCCVLLNDHLPQNNNGFQLFVIIFSRWRRLKGRVIHSRTAPSEHQHASCIIIDETSVGANNPDRCPFSEMCLINNWPIINTGNSRLYMVIRRIINAL